MGSAARPREPFLPIAFGIFRSLCLAALCVTSGTTHSGAIERRGAIHLAHWPAAGAALLVRPDLEAVADCDALVEATAAKRGGSGQQHLARNRAGTRDAQIREPALVFPQRDTETRERESIRKLRCAVSIRMLSVWVPKKSRRTAR